jgi:hypothetical protein
MTAHAEEEGWTAGMEPETRYAKSEDLHIAYQVVGQGPKDLVLVPPFVSHVEHYWEEPLVSRFLTRLASFSRLILFNKRGTGLSDRVAPQASVRAAIFLSRHGCRRLVAGDRFLQGDGAACWRCGSALGRVRSQAGKFAGSGVATTTWRSCPVGFMTHSLSIWAWTSKQPTMNLRPLGDHRLEQLEPVVGASNHSQALAVRVDHHDRWVRRRGFDVEGDPGAVGGPVRVR